MVALTRDFPPTATVTDTLGEKWGQCLYRNPKTGVRGPVRKGAGRIVQTPPLETAACSSALFLDIIRVKYGNRTDGG